MASDSGILDAINKYRQHLTVARTTLPNGQVVSTPQIDCRFVELLGGQIVETLTGEPDPVTYHSDWYYNTRFNILYHRQWVRREPKLGIMLAKWENTNSSNRNGR